MSYDPNKTPTEEFPTIPTLTLGVTILLDKESCRTIVHMPEHVSISTDVADYTYSPVDPITRVVGDKHRWTLVHRRVVKPTNCTMRFIHRHSGKVLELQISFELPASV